jgi:hypothetical protein
MMETITFSVISIVTKPHDITSQKTAFFIYGVEWLAIKNIVMIFVLHRSGGFASS